RKQPPASLHEHIRWWVQVSYKRTLPYVRYMSALPPKFGTILMSALCQKRTNPWFALFDHLVGKREQVRRPRETERFHGLDIDHQFELGWLHHWQIRRLLPFEDAASVTAELMICLGKVSTVTHQTARRGELAEFVYRGNRILCGERYERFAVRVEERIGCNEKRTSRLSGKRGKSCAELVCSGDFHNIDLQLQSTRRRLDFAYDSLGIRVAGVHKYADYFRLWHKFMQKFKLLGLHSNGEQMYSGGISTWMIEARDKAELDRVARNIKHNRDR